MSRLPLRLAGLLALLTACPNQLPAPVGPTSEQEAEGDPDRVGPTWLPAELVDVTPSIGTAPAEEGGSEGIRVLTPRVTVTPGVPTAEDEYPLDDVAAELVVVTPAGEKVWLSEHFALDTSSCDPEVELAAIEGVTVPLHYMFQLTCSGGGDSVFVDSFTMLVRVRPESEEVIVLWEGEGSSTNERDACLEYDVVGFRVAEDGTQVQIVRDRERISGDEEGGDPDCVPMPFEQLPVARVDLREEADNAVHEIETPPPAPPAETDPDALPDVDQSEQSYPGEDETSVDENAELPAQETELPDTEELP